MKRARLFGFKEGQGCVPALAGVVVGLVLFVAIGVVNISLSSAVSPGEEQCRGFSLASAIEIGLSILTAIVALLALFGPAGFRKLPSWFRISLFTVAALMLIPTPCSFTGVGGTLFIRCGHPLSFASVAQYQALEMT